MRSKALEQLKDRIRDLDQLLEAHSQIGGRKRGRRWKLDALNRASLMLLCSHLEGFLEDLFEEMMGKLLEAKIHSSIMPRNVKLLGFRRRLIELPARTHTRKSKTALLEIFKKVEKYGHPRKTITPEDIKRADYEAELQRFANPKPEAINDLFWNLGIDDILSRISWKRTSSKMVWRYLEKLVDKRNKIAHGTVGVKVKKEEVKAYRRFLWRFAEKIENTVAAHLKNIFMENARVGGWTRQIEQKNGTITKMMVAPFGGAQIKVKFPCRKCRRSVESSEDIVLEEPNYFAGTTEESIVWSENGVGKCRRCGEEHIIEVHNSLSGMLVEIDGVRAGNIKYKVIHYQL